MYVTMLRLSSDPGNLDQVEIFAKDLASRYKISADKYPNILISLTEAVNNAIIHGNQGDNEKIVSIYLRHSDSGITIRVCDQGSGFNPHSVPDPTSPDQIEQEGGRGVFLIRELCDHCSYLDEGRTLEMFFEV